MAQTAPIDQTLIKAITQLKVTFEVYEHPDFSSCEISATWHEANKKKGQRVKNLFLRNKNGKRHFLLMLPHAYDFEKARFKELSGEKCGLASDERLWAFLKTKPGAVSPLSVYYDADHQVEVFIEASLLQAESLHFHPGTSQASVVLTPDALIHVLSSWHRAPQVIDWDASSSAD